MKNTIKKMLSVAACSFIFSGSLMGQEIQMNFDDTFNPTHENRFSFMLGVNPSLTKSGDMSNFTFSYARKMENFWLDSNVMMT